MICVDASIIVAVLQPEELSDKADLLIQRWGATREQMVAPDFLIAEVSSAVRRGRYTGRTAPDEADVALQEFRMLPIRLHSCESLLDAAWGWGERLNTPRLYDMFYLALAEQLACDLWVVEKKLVNIVGSQSARVRWVGDVEDGPNP